MAVGKGSMARASKAVEKTTEMVEEMHETKTPEQNQENLEKPIEDVKLTGKKQNSRKKKSATKVEKEEKSQSSELKETEQNVVKQQEKSNVVALGEEMPVYYL